jgi:hypothetical protein
MAPENQGWAYIHEVIGPVGKYDGFLKEVELRGAVGLEL